MMHRTVVRMRVMAWAWSTCDWVHCACARVLGPLLLHIRQTS